jgi:hypothetical protein
MCTDLFGATAPVVVPNRAGRLLLIMSKAAARKIDFWFFWLLVTGYWLLVTGYWLLITDYKVEQWIIKK